MEQNILNNYEQKVLLAQTEADKYKNLANKYSLLRLVIFGLFILSVSISIAINEIIVLVLFTFILIGGFSWLIKKQSSCELLMKYYIDLKRVIENEISSILNNKSIYYNGSIFNNDKHYYTADLDIYGEYSLFSLLNRSATYSGLIKLAKWLNSPSNKNTILLRQEAINELSGKSDWKLDFQANLLFSLAQGKDQIKNLLNYLKIPLEFEDKKFISFYCKIAPFVFLCLIIISVFYSPLRYFIPVISMFNFRQVSSRKKYIEKADLVAGKIGTALFHFVAAFEGIEKETWQAPYFSNLISKINVNGAKVSDSISQLSILINKLNYRLNLVVSFILNIIFLWDIRQIIAIENWKRNNQKSLETAFDVIAEFEALISLASLKINYPDWAMPEIIEEDDYTLIATGLAHPLINSSKRVKNDYELNNTRKIDIITGSNMAGKSTFLRTVGINTVLALCGAPVCAEEMKVSVITIISYMRIKDNLNESTSTFKAELDRLQMLLNEVTTNKKVFFLIDEMLRGTNSVDKYLGSKAVIKNLIAKNAVGMVATHDLQIADLENSYPDYIRNFYFDIQVKHGEMLFDYKIKPGACKTFNATLLLKQIGIEVE